MRWIRPLRSLSFLLLALAGDTVRFLRSLVRARSSLIAENLFLRKQLAFYQEHQIPPKRLTNAARFLLALWSNFFAYEKAPLIVQPATLIRWHRQGFKLFWKSKSKPGRPRLPKDLRRLIAEMVRANPTWGQARIANELSLKLGIQVSPRTVRAYWPEDMGPSPRRIAQTWNTFIRNHAQVIVACDFMVAITAPFRILYIFVLLEIGSRRILHCNVTAQPTADWTLQQFREAIPGQHPYRALIHDRHGTFSAELDQADNRWRGRLACMERSCCRRARFSRMRSLREPKALIIQPKTCRSNGNIAKMLSERLAATRTARDSFYECAKF